jgi:hypothetical protein
LIPSTFLNAVFPRIDTHIGSSLFSVQCQKQLWAMSSVSGNPKGIESISPGLRGTSYPGEKTEEFQTLKGLNFLHKSLIISPLQ